MRLSRTQLALACAWFALAVTGCASPATDAGAPPNILLITVDDLGYGDLGSYGHPVIESPNLDALASEGLRLTQYYAPSGLCSPSRAGVLTGRLPYRTGIKSWIPEGSGIYLRDDEITLAELLRDAGYRTALIGKWHLNADLGSDDEPQPTDQGFEVFYGHNAFQIPTNRNPTNVYRNRELLPPQQGYTADLYADEAIRWLDSIGSERFFLYLSMAEPHTTIENPPEENARYAQYTDGPIVPIPSGESTPPKDKLIPRGPGEYYANISYLDKQLGRVLAHLQATNRKDNTLVVFVSDNGPVTSDWINWWEVNAYGSTGGLRGRKHGLYEGGIRVPAIVRWPGVTKAQSESDEPIIGMDLFTTLAHIGGATVPDDRPIDGEDVRDALSGEEVDDRRRERTLFWALDSVSELEYAIRRGDWKLMLDSAGEPRELYNLADDPLEFFSVLDDEPDIAATLTASFHAIRSTLGSAGPARTDSE